MKFKTNNLEEALLAGTVIMLRNDGEYFQVGIHPYIKEVTDIHDLDIAARTNRDCLKWYHDYTNNKDLKDSIEVFIAMYKHSHKNYKDPLESQNIQFVHNKQASIALPDKFSNDELISLWNHIYDLSCQEFVKVRVSGEYRFSEDTMQDVYFRVASTGFNWFNIIWQFVAENIQDDLYINIVRDEELTGKFFYYNDGKNYFKHMPVDEFLTVKGNPVVEKLNIKRGNLRNMHNQYITARTKEIKENYR